jgi:FAD/FMN-containing dehydrogenase
MPVPFDSLRASVSGGVITPEDPRYEETRALFNAMVRKTPAAIARCATSEDVAASIAFAGQHDLDLAVRAGGHSVAGHSLCDDGLVIDVRPMKMIDVDPVRKTARVGAGVTWGEFDAAAQEHGLVTTGGRVSTTGVAGFTLGGGSGWIERSFGLACDNLISVDLVTAQCETVTASEFENTDLFWALHGGGGNFGVATSFEFRLHDLGPIVLAGLMLWDGNVGRDVALAYRDWAATVPDEMGSGLVYLTGPPEEFVPEHLQGRTCIGFAACYTGDTAEGERVLAPMRSLAPEVDLVGEMPYAAFNSMLDDPPGKRNYWSAEYMAGFPDDAVDVFVKYAANLPSPFTQHIMLPWGGQVARVSSAETPMTQRDAAWITHPFAVWEGEENDETSIRWAREYAADMRPFATGGIYLNFIGDEGQDRVRAAYGPNFDRIAKIKGVYDPDNIFRGNQNIKPA